MAWDDMLDEWTEWLSSSYLTGRHLSKNTVKWYKAGVEQFFTLIEQPPDPQKMGYNNLAWAMSRIPFSPGEGSDHFSQRNRLYGGYRSFCRYLLRKGYEYPGLYENVSPIKPKQRLLPKERLLSLQQFVALKNGIQYVDIKPLERQQLNISIDIMTYAGLRRAELVNLLRSDVDLNRRRLRVLGKGLKERHLGICEELAVSLNDWFANSLTHTKAVFHCAESTGLRKINRWMAALVDHTDIPCDCHTLRHTFAAALEEAGVPLSQIQEMLGHADIETTMRYLRYAKKASIKTLQAFTFLSATH